MYLTNDIILNLTTMTILQNLCKDIDYFLHFKKIGTNLQKRSKVRDQNVYLLYFKVYILTLKIEHELKT